MTSSPLAAVRFRVVAFTVALAFVTYLDRVCISKLAGPISHDLGLSMQEMGYVFSSFTLAYAIFEVPTARWADRLGARLVLTRIVVWWSIFTMVTAAAFNFWSLVIVRFLFGIGEAGACPWPPAPSAAGSPNRNADASKASSSPAPTSPAASLLTQPSCSNNTSAGASSS